MAARPHWDSGPSAQLTRHIAFSQLPGVATMDTNSPRQKRRDGVFSVSNVAIEAVFDSVSILLAVVGVNFLLFFDSL